MIIKMLASAMGTQVIYLIGYNFWKSNVFKIG